jgi:hypothetical protein
MHHRAPSTPRAPAGRRYHRFVPASLETILGPDYLAGLAELPVEALRERRRECQAVESGLSLVRRLAQGRLDIVEAERSRRATASEVPNLERLIAQLPAILSDHTSSSGRGSLLDVDATPEGIDTLIAELDGIVGPTALSALSELSADSLVEVYDALNAFEHGLSTQRHGLHERIDTIEHEMVLRYQRGEASVETFLH